MGLTQRRRGAEEKRRRMISSFLSLRFLSLCVSASLRDAICFSTYGMMMMRGLVSVARAKKPAESPEKNSVDSADSV
jgi:hypothetical protein